MTRNSIFAVLFMAAGAWSLFAEPHYSAWRRRLHEEHLADRLARGSDAYFEELRAIHAYSPQRVSAFQRKVWGALMILGGLAYLALNFIR
jgi:hypothetical protein